MSDPNRPEPAAAAPAREAQREGGQQQREGGAQHPQQHADQQRGGAQNQLGRRGMRRRHGGGREGQQQQQPSYTSRAEASINMDELRELFGLIASQGFTEFELEKEGFRVRLRRDLGGHTGPSPTGFAAPQPQIHSTEFAGLPATQASGGSAQRATQGGAGEGKSEEGAAAEVELEKITSPIVGTFYRSPSPTAEAFVDVGSRVGPETVVCIVEAMKLMNEIKAETSGIIEKVYVENGQPVEFGQPLFGIRK